MSVFFVTNNPQIARRFPLGTWLDAAKAAPQVLRPEEKQRRGAFCLLFDADALPVLTTARDAIHNGWRLTHHPLYGNYRPNQQPYRSLILEYHHHNTTGNGRMPVPDLTSLHLIEEALLVYNNCAILSPRMAPASLLEACALLDWELMRLPFQQAGIWTDSMEEISRKKRPAMRLA